MKISLVILAGFCTLAITYGHVTVGGHVGLDSGILPGFGVGVHANLGHGVHEKHHERSGNYESHVLTKTHVNYEVPEHIRKIFYRKADKVMAHRQKEILALLYHLNQESHVPEHIEIVKTFSPFSNTKLYSKDGVVEKFQQYWQYGLLPKGAVFSIFNENHLHQAMALSKLLYFATDYDVFYKTAVWARMNVNEGMFVYCLHVAVVHRADTKGIMLPPIYEIAPHMFFNADVINKAQQYKQMYEARQHDEGKGYNGYTIESNYTGHHVNLDREQTALAYYLEDVGLNAFFYYLHIHYPFWMNGSEFGWNNLPRGDFYYTCYRNILARYYLERLPYGYDDIKYLNWDLPVDTPYHSNLVYPNGMPFPNRPKFAKLHEYFYNYGQTRWAQNVYGYSYTYVNNFERRIVDAIESGAIWSEEKGQMVQIKTEEFSNVLGNLIEANRDSPNFHYYGPIWFFARHLLGYSTQQWDQEEFVPSALEHFETSLRDPVFYQLIKRLVVLPYQKYLGRLPAYNKSQLVFPGVEVSKVELGPLYTYTDEFYANLANSVFYKPNEVRGDFNVRVRQYRLNHEPFEYKLHVKSDKSQKATVKVFIGPKYDRNGRPIKISQNRLNFVELDHYVVDLQAGDNVVTRKSSDVPFYTPDKISSEDIYRNAAAAVDGVHDFNIDLRQNFYGFPQRFMIPKGSECGTPYQLFFAVYPHTPYQGSQHTHNLNEVLVDNYPQSYPLDRFIKWDRMWEQIPNFYSQEVKVYYKGEKRSW